MQLREKNAQAQLLIKTQENEQLMRSQNIKLEEKVKERTQEIERQKEIAEKVIIEKEVLLKEIHHRVKNNLQTISSMLMLQNSRLSDGAAKSILTESQVRVRAIALVHEKLYQAERMERVELNGLVADLATEIKSFYQLQSGNVSIVQNIPETYVSSDKAVSIGLILNELFTNSYKHAFKDIEAGFILISLSSVEQDAGETHPASKKVKLSYSDSGKGMFSEDIFSNPSGLGLRLVKLLAEQIGASTSYSNIKGSEFNFIFDINI